MSYLVYKRSVDLLYLSQYPWISAGIGETRCGDILTCEGFFSILFQPTIDAESVSGPKGIGSEEEEEKSVLKVVEKYKRWRT
jgi:hypothetical protein